MLESTLTDNGQTTVPKGIRKALALKPRQRLQWNLASNGSVSVIPEPCALSLYGSLKSPRKFAGFKKEKAGIRKHVARLAALEDRRRKPA